MSTEIMTTAQAIYECLKPCKVYLFGSYARGTENKDSDYDFYVVVADEVENTFQCAADAYGVAHKVCSKPLDILVRKNSKFEKRRLWPATVEREVAREGVLLCE